jgi:hypothetical protein
MSVVFWDVELAVTRDEYEWLSPAHEDIGDRIGFDALQVDVQQGAIEICGSGKLLRVGDGRGGTYDIYAQLPDSAHDCPRNCEIVLDQQEFFESWPGLAQWPSESFVSDSHHLPI